MPLKKCIENRDLVTCLVVGKEFNRGIKIFVEGFIGASNFPCVVK
jgi:hypothetical protein